jgi:hypothetical protein
MTDVTLHFKAAPGMDATAVAKQLQERCAALAEIEAARSERLASRVIGVDDVLLVLTVSAKLFAAGALSLEALKRLLVAAKAVAEELGLKSVTVEGAFGRQVDPAKLTEADALAISKRAKPG